MIHADNQIIHLVNSLLQDAIEKKVSDIHFEPLETHYRIRFRLEGLLQEITSFPHTISITLLTRIKIMADLNIAEKRLPQDGRFTLTHPRKVDIRVSTCPALFGEKMVLRILDIKHTALSLDKLGLSSAQLQLFYEKLSTPQGLILVTGPTGSGKTITLYAALNYLNHIEKNITSIEDPIEIELAGINQIPINHKIGFSFSNALRTILRQDPDVIMLGEIRDSETANLAVEAAQTGHLVLSTLHTNNATEAILRLQTMHIPTHHLVNSLSLIIAERLVRTLCVFCRENTTKNQIRGCAQCRQGYLGRIGIFEMIPITPTLSHMIAEKSPLSTLMNHIKQQKYLLLAQSGLEKVAHGLTNLQELKRVLGTDAFI